MNTKNIAPPQIAALRPAKQAARELGIPYTSLRDLAFAGRIPVIRFGRSRDFDPRDMAALVERSRETLG